MLQDYGVRMGPLDFANHFTGSSSSQVNIDYNHESLLPCATYITHNHTIGSGECYC